MTGRQRCPISRKPVEFCRGTEFYTSCRAFRAVIALRFGFEIDYCRCLEAELQTQAIENPQINHQTEEVTMGAVKRKFSKCDQCGAEKNTCMHYGKNVCSGCISMRIAVKNKPEAVLAALAEFGHMPKPETIEIYPVQGEDVAALKSDNEILKRKIAEMSDKAILDAERIADYHLQLLAYGKLLDHIATELGFKESAEIHIPTEVSILKQEKDRLQELLDDATAELDAQDLAKNSHQPTDVARAGVLLDIVMDAMAGKITGLDVGRLQALR